MGAHFVPEFFQTLFREAPVALALWSMHEGEFVAVNRAFADILGRTIEETLQLSFWQVTPRRFEKQENEQLKLLHTVKRYGPYDKHFIRKDGSLVPVTLSGSVVNIDGCDYILSRVEESVLDASFLASIPTQPIKHAVPISTAQPAGRLDDPPKASSPTQPIKHAVPISTAQLAGRLDDPPKASSEVNQSCQPPVSANVIVTLAQQTNRSAAEPRRATFWWTLLAGAGSSLEFFPPPERIDYQQTDLEAFSEDWQAVASDMWAAIGSCELETAADVPADGRPIQE